MLSIEHSAVRPSSVENGCLIGWMTGEFQVVALILCMDAFMMIVNRDHDDVCEREFYLIFSPSPHPHTSLLYVSVVLLILVLSTVYGIFHLYLHLLVHF